MKDLAQLERDFKAFERALATKVPNESNKRIAMKVVILAKHLSSGQYSSAELAKMGHPYGKGFARVIASGSRFGTVVTRGPIPYGNPAVINKQSGSFYNSWIVQRTADIKGAPAIMVVNTAPYASFLETGTYKMVKRPLDVALAQYINEIGPGIFQEEFSKAWQTQFG